MTVTALLALAASSCLAAVAAVPPARGAHRSARWGQDDPLVVQSVFAKVGGGARKEKFAAENQGWLARLVGIPPAIQARVDLSEEYLPDDSPASTSPSGDVVRVGRAALDLSQSEAELAFLLGHELHHTLARPRKRQCLRAGAAEAGSFAKLKVQPAYKAYVMDLEREADAWGQRYMANAGYNAFAAVDALRHIGDLGEDLGAEPLLDDDHDTLARREERLKSFGGAPHETTCPWLER